MPIFEKVVQESGGKNHDLKTSLEDKLKQQKMRELDEAAIDSTVQATRTKTAELEAREIEAQGRKVNVEATMMEKLMPTGMWGLLAEVLKDKNPQQPMTVQDMLTILEYARGQQEGVPAPDQPSEGMWGFLSTMMTTMMSKNQSMTPIELIQTIQNMNNMMHPQQQAPSNPLSQLTEFATMMQTLRDFFAPHPQNGGTAALVEMPGGGHMTLDQIMQWQNHGFDLKLRQDEHNEKIKNWEAARQNAPGFIDAIKEFAATLRGEIEQKPGNTSGSPGSTRVKKPGQKQEVNKQGETQSLVCPDCQLPFSLPSGIDEEVACPRCSMQVLKRLEEASNARQTDKGSGEGKGPGEEAGDQGKGGPDMP